MMRQGDGSMASVARAIGQRTRTLQRNLRTEGVGFSELVDEVRAGEARRYVAEGNLSYGRDRVPSRLLAAERLLPRVQALDAHDPIGDARSARDEASLQDA